MAESPQVSLLFPWLALIRQINITGRAEKPGALEAVKCLYTGREQRRDRARRRRDAMEDLKHRLSPVKFHGVPSTAAGKL